MSEHKQKRGKFFAIEGTNASGKATQFQMLVDRLCSEGYDVVTFDFPQYANESSFYVRQYLSGTFGTPEEVGPYTASLFYALDRYQARAAIKTALEQGKIVIANRYSGSNMAHQGTKFGRPEERRGFYLWLDDLEFRMLKIPRPDKNFVLRVDASTAQRLLKERSESTGQELDAHEKDSSHMKRAVTVYDELCVLFPKDFTRIDCVRGGDLLKPDLIHEILWQTMQEFLPEPRGVKGSVERASEVNKPFTVHAQPKKTQQVSLLDAIKLRLPILGSSKESILKTLRPEERDHNGNYAYYIPDGLSGETKTVYTSTMNQLFGTYSKLYNQLRKTIPEVEARTALQGIIPMSILVTSEVEALITKPKPNLVFNQLAETMLPSMHSKADNPVRLVSCEPRNEFDLIPYMLYEQSNLSLSDIHSAVETWTYEEKEKVFRAYLVNRPTTSVLQKISYTWDVFLDFISLLEFLALPLEATVQVQEETTRYGFSTPKSIIETGITEKYEQSFTLALEASNLLLEERLNGLVSYVLLAGHNMRALINVQGLPLNQRATNISEQAQRMIKDFSQIQTEKHPLLSESTRT